MSVDIWAAVRARSNAAHASGALYRIQSEPFFESGMHDTFPDALFFSFTTLTTTGFGNLVPARNPGQTFAVMEMLLGQLFLITAVAKVINAWQPTRWRLGAPSPEDAGGSDGEPPTSEGRLP